MSDLPWSCMCLLFSSTDEGRGTVGFSCQTEIGGPYCLKAVLLVLINLSLLTCGFRNMKVTQHILNFSKLHFELEGSGGEPMACVLQWATESSERVIITVLGYCIRKIF